MMNETKRTWVRPQANVQTFQMNDYVSACYEVTCITPLNNAEFKKIGSIPKPVDMTPCGTEI